MRPVAVLGAGGHAKVVVATLLASGRSVTGCYVPREVAPGAASEPSAVLGVAVHLESALVLADADVIVAIGDNCARARVARAYAARGAAFASAVHPSAVVHGSATIEPGAVVFAGAIVQPDTHIGEHAIVNTSAHIDHDGRIGPFAHVAPGAHLAGDVTIAEGAFVGTGASIIPGRTVGAWSVVGAGAAVVKHVDAGVVVAGVPARALAGRTAARIKQNIEES